jgi:tetratricopeptide (TPR) repeat protein
MSNGVQPRRSTRAERQSSDRQAPSDKTWARAILVIAVVVTFCRACRYDFINFDDYQTVVDNPLMNPTTLHSLRIWWTSPNFQLYDPMTATVRGGVASLARVSPDPATGESLNPWVFHTVNILLHIGVTLLVFQLLLCLKLPPWPACGGALLFAIHPVQVEPVVWITSIKDLLYGTFALLAIWRLLVSLDSPADALEPDASRGRSLRNYLAATLFFLLAMFSKPTAVSVPLVALPLVWMQCRSVPPRAWYRLAFWLVLAIPFSIIAKFAQPAPQVPAIAIWKRLLVAGDAVAFYLFKIVWPKTLILHYGRNPVYITQHGFIWWTWMIPAALIAVLWLNRRRCAPALAGMLVFVAALLPVLGLVRFNFQYYSTVADRYLYIPMFGIALIAGWGLSRLPSRYAVFAAVPLLLLAWRTAMQVGYWQDSLTLFGHVLDNEPRSAVAYSQYATELLRKLDFKRCCDYARKSIALDPNRCEPYDTLAKALDDLDQTDAAVQTYREGFRHDPTITVPLNDLTLDLLRESTPQHALIFARLNVQLAPEVVPFTNLGAALAETGDWQGARQALQTAVSLDPTSYNAQCDLASVLYHIGDIPSAIAHYHAAEAIDPDDLRAADALKQLGADISQSQRFQP